MLFQSKGNILNIYPTMITWFIISLQDVFGESVNTVFTVFEKFYLPTWTVGKLWANSERAVGEHWTELDEWFEH